MLLFRSHPCDERAAAAWRVVLCPYACGPAAGTSKGHRGDARHDDRADQSVSAPTVAEPRPGEAARPPARL